MITIKSGIKKSIKKWKEIKKKIRTETVLECGYNEIYWNSCGYCDVYRDCKKCLLGITEDRAYKMPYCQSIPSISNSIAKATLLEADLYNWKQSLIYINILLDKMQSDLNSLKERS